MTHDFLRWVRKPLISCKNEEKNPDKKTFLLFNLRPWNSSQSCKTFVPVSDNIFGWLLGLNSRNSVYSFEKYWKYWLRLKKWRYSLINSLRNSYISQHFFKPYTLIRKIYTGNHPQIFVRDRDKRLTTQQKVSGS